LIFFKLLSKVAVCPLFVYLFVHIYIDFFLLHLIDGLIFGLCIHEYCSVQVSRQNDYLVPGSVKMIIIIDIFQIKKKSIPLNEVDSSILQWSSIPLQEIPWLFPIIYMSQATTTLVLHWITRSPSLYNSYNQKTTFVTNWIKKIRKSFLRSRIFFKLSLKNDVGFILRRRNRFETCKIL
jgi:hypothetical protein